MYHRCDTVVRAICTHGRVTPGLAQSKTHQTERLQTETYRNLKFISWNISPSTIEDIHSSVYLWYRPEADFNLVENSTLCRFSKSWRILSAAGSVTSMADLSGIRLAACARHHNDANTIWPIKYSTNFCDLTKPASARVIANLQC